MSVLVDGVSVRLPDEAFPVAPPESRRAEPERESVDAAPSGFVRLLRQVGRNIEQGERIVANAAGGYATLDAAELIALQAGIYRYSEAVDLTAKLVDRTTSAVRTVLQGGH